jgi:2-C-methyl-D-erythritol 4-phosphate cytidylyltransferase
MTLRTGVIIPAAGAGRRMGASKAFLELAGRPVLAHTLAPFLREPRITHVVVALPAAVAAAPPAWLTGLDPRVCIVPGGEERTDSVSIALEAMPADLDVIVVHDAARPLLTNALVARTLDEAGRGRCVTVALPLADTLHEVDAEGRVLATPERSRFWLAQTPQAFPAAALREAYRRARQAGERATDDAALVARFVGPVYVIAGERSNLKLTTPADLQLAEVLLGGR